MARLPAPRASRTSARGGDAPRSAFPRPAPPLPAPPRLSATACRSASALMISRQGFGKGSNFNAVNPRATISFAASPSASGVFAPPPQPFAYTRTRPRHGPPSRLYTGCPAALPAISHSACSMPRKRTIEVHRAALRRVIEVHHTREVLDRPRVAPDEIPRHLLDVDHNRAVTVCLCIRLAPTVQPASVSTFTNSQFLPVPGCTRKVFTAVTCI